MKVLLPKLLTTMLLTCVLLSATRADADLIAHYGFDGGTLGADSSGNSRTMSLSSTSPPTSSGTDKFGGQSAAFDGNLQYLYRDDSAFDFGTGDFAVSLWYQRNDSGTYNLIGNGTQDNIGTDPKSGFILQVSDANATPTLTLYQGETAVVTSAPTLLSDDDAAFQHVLFQRDGGEYQVYVNNAAPDTNSPTLQTLNTGLAFAIGAMNVTSGGSLQSPDEYNGLIDEVFVFNNALSESEITGLFENNTFTGISGGGGGGGGIPEPSSFLLLLTGMLFASRRRNRVR